LVQSKHNYFIVNHKCGNVFRLTESSSGQFLNLTLWVEKFRHIYDWQYSSSFRFLWPCIVNIRWRERTNKMQLIRCVLSNFLSQHVSGIIMPIIRRIRPCPTASGVLPGCVGCGWLWSCGVALWAARTARSSQCNSTRPQPTTAYTPRQNTACRRTRSYSRVMGIMMPETCWDRKSDNKHRISCILLVPSLNLMFTMHGHKILKL
jgi:hypothetical protein